MRSAFAVPALLIALLLPCRAAAVSPAALHAAASAKWDLAAARELTAELTDERLAAIAGAYGGEKGEALRAKRDAVAGLLGRYRSGTASGADLTTADAHLERGFREEIYGLFSGGGAPAPAAGTDIQISLSDPRLEQLSALLQQGKLTEKDLAALYDGSLSGRGGAVVQAAPAAQAAATSRAAFPAPRPAAALRASAVPLPAAAPADPAGKYVRPPMPDINETGRVHKALNRWDARRRKQLEAYKNSTGAEKVKAGAALSGAAVMQGLLFFSGLTQVEYAAARLGWDKANGAPAGVIAADAGKLLFHSAVVVITFLPVPIVPAFSAALAGNPVAIAYVLAMFAGPANRFIFHLVD